MMGMLKLLCEKCKGELMFTIENNKILIKSCDQCSSKVSNEFYSAVNKVLNEKKG